MPEFPGYGNQLASQSVELLYSGDMAPVSGSPNETPSPREHVSSMAKAATLTSAARKNSTGRKSGPSRAWKLLDDAAYSSSDDMLGKPTRRRGFSISSDHSDMMMTENGNDIETSNPRKRSSTDALDYPRRRATIAVRTSPACIVPYADKSSAKSVAVVNPAVTAPSHVVVSALSSAPSASTGSLASSWMRGTSLSWSVSAVSKACCQRDSRLLLVRSAMTSLWQPQMRAHRP
jgi:hypothetical protein